MPFTRQGYGLTTPNKGNRSKRYQGYIRGGKSAWAMPMPAGGRGGYAKPGEALP